MIIRIYYRRPDKPRYREVEIAGDLEAAIDVAIGLVRSHPERAVLATSPYDSFVSRWTAEEFRPPVTVVSVKHRDRKPAGVS